MIRVLVAEDSPTVRELLVEILESDPGIQVVGQAKNGQEAVELAERLRPDLITMDIHMPLLDGLEATKEIMVRAPTPILIVSSAASQRDVELSLSATRAGALMVTGPPGHPLSQGFDERRRQLVSLAKSMAQVRVVRHWRQGARPAPRRHARTNPTAEVRLIAIAASTGGPAALQRVLAGLPRDFAAPVLVVQHIAPGFVDGLCTWLKASCDLRVRIAVAGARLEPRTVYLAPDDRHLGVGGDATVQLSAAPPIGGFRPSANFLFDSAARSFGASTVAVILTGMGSDGVQGLRSVHEAGGHVLAQDESSSVVFGMPGEAVRAGVVDAVLPIGEIAPRLVEFMKGDPDAVQDPRR